MSELEDADSDLGVIVLDYPIKVEMSKTYDHTIDDIRIIESYEPWLLYTDIPTVPVPFSNIITFLPIKESLIDVYCAQVGRFYGIASDTVIQPESDFEQDINPTNKTIH
jgi:hypothetical protein